MTTRMRDSRPAHYKRMCGILHSLCGCSKIGFRVLNWDHVRVVASKQVGIASSVGWLRMCHLTPEILANSTTGDRDTTLFV